MPPDWLHQLAEELTACIEPIDRRAPIGCHFCYADDCWEVTLFVSRTEVLGGEYDGEQIPGRFNLDVTRLLTVLEQVDGCWWQPLPVAADDELRSHLSLEGRHAGQCVWVRITAEQPAAIESGRIANVLTGAIERRW